MSTPVRSTLAFACALSFACAGSQTVTDDTITAPDAAEGNEQEARAQRDGLELKQYDLNRDQIPDVFKFFKLGADTTRPGQEIEQLVRKEIDINHDGRIDIIQLWDSEGNKTEELTDLDFDGRLDERVIYDQGRPARKEIDLNYDGEADVFKYYVEGQLHRIESDRTGNGKVDTWEYFEGGELDRIGTDTDADGEVDQWEKKRADDTKPSQDSGAAAEAEKPAETPGDAKPNETAADSDEPPAEPTEG